MHAKTMLRNAYHAVRQQQDKRAINRAAQLETNPALRRAFERAATHALSADERRRIAEIAALRAQLDASSEKIDVLDFGAGSSQTGWRTPDEMTHGVTVPLSIADCSRASKDDLWGTLLFMIVRETGARRGLELGTNLGISAAYQAAAMQLNGGGLFVTCEGAPALADRARKNFEHLGLDNVRVVTGRFADTLPEVCRTQGPFDYVFIDGHHDGDATLEYYRQILPHTVAGAIFAFDDIDYSAGMRSAWDRLRGDTAVKHPVEFPRFGICVTDPGGAAEGRPAVTAP